jgi:hypothetical protein
MDSIQPATTDMERQSTSVPSLSLAEWDMLAQLLPVLGIIRDVSIQFQSRNVFLSDAVVLILSLKEDTRPSDFDAVWLQQMKNEFIQSLVRYFSKGFLAPDSVGCRACFSIIGLRH